MGKPWYNYCKAGKHAKVCKLDDIVTPLRLLKLFFDDVLVEMIFGYTKFYSHREEAHISFEITIEKVCL